MLGFHFHFLGFLFPTRRLCTVQISACSDFQLSHRGLGVPTVAKTLDWETGPLSCQSGPVLYPQDASPANSVSVTNKATKQVTGT